MSEHTFDILISLLAGYCSGAISMALLLAQTVGRQGYHK